MLAGLALLIAFMGFWMVWVILQALCSASENTPACRRAACILIGDRADLAEWLVRRLCGERDYLLGRLDLVMAVSCESGETASITRVLSARAGLEIISQDRWCSWETEKAREVIRIDVRGKSIRDLNRCWSIRATA